MSAFVIWYLIALYYLANVSAKVSPLRSDAAEEALAEYKYGIFDCFSNPTTCFWGCCCPCIRWGDNVRMLGICSFWLAALCYAISQPTWLLFALVGAFFRMEVRSKFKMATGATAFLTESK